MDADERTVGLLPVTAVMETQRGLCVPIGRVAVVGRKGRKGLRGKARGHSEAEVEQGDGLGGWGRAASVPGRPAQVKGPNAKACKGQRVQPCPQNPRSFVLRW